MMQLIMMPVAGAATGMDGECPPHHRIDSIKPPAKGLILSPSARQAVNAERRRVHHEADVVIVGAGIFGCAAAFAFAQQGRSVILLERWMKEPDRIVGELLQPEESLLCRNWAWAIVWRESMPSRSRDMM